MNINRFPWRHLGCRWFKPRGRARDRKGGRLQAIEKVVHGGSTATTRTRLLLISHKTQSTKREWPKSKCREKERSSTGAQKAPP